MPLPTMPLPASSGRRIAILELSALQRLHPDALALEGVSITKATPIYDLSGEVLFHRFSLSAGKHSVGVADIAAHEALGSPLLAVSRGMAWDGPALLAAASAAARKAERVRFDTMRFVAYSFPKLAVQFLQEEQEVLMLECWTWRRVPPARRDLDRPPGNFERWSLLEQLSGQNRREREEGFSARLALWETGRFKTIESRVISAELLNIPPTRIQLFDNRELHYSEIQTDHHVCYELRGQLTSVWCVAASTQMLLNFYRYSYDQERVAKELGLGTLSSPSGLPYSRDGDVVTSIETLTSNALDASMNTTPTFDEFRTEIQANRPLISFIPGHSRTVAGYTHSVIAFPGLLTFRGLLVYDPWPPTTGVITRWENFDTQSYRLTFTAALNQI